MAPGDGVGPEVTDAATRVLTAAGLQWEAVPVDVGLGAHRATGASVPPDALAACRDADAVLFGATTTPPGDPDYRSAIVTLRRELGLTANVRPARSVPCLGREGLDLTIVRENTEGLYAGDEARDGDHATAVRHVTRDASERVARHAFRLAEATDGAGVTAAHKANVLPVTDGLFLEACRRVADAHPHVAYAEALVDSLAARIILDPAPLDVIVTTNLFGDILSDVAAGLMGSLGLAASANVGPEHALFEPVHGSAPDIAGKGVANPAGAIRSAALMLRHLGEAEAAARVERAVDRALARPETRTRDVGGVATTHAMTDYICMEVTP